MATAGSPTNDANKAAQGVKNTAKFAQNLKKIIQAIKAIRMAATSATGVGALANAALLLKDKVQKYRKQIAAAAAGAVGLYLFYLYLLWLKALGALAGLAFGLVTGLPLLAIPGAGPFLYAGWVGFWTAKGFLDPAGTINLATHPWEAVTKPLGWVKSQLGNLGSGATSGTGYITTGASSAMSGAASAAGSFVTGVASSVWGGISSAGGSVWGAISSGFSTVTGALTSGGGAIAGNLATVAVGGTVTTAFAGTMLTAVMTNSAYFTPEMDKNEAFAPPQQPGDNEFFTIKKSANPQALAAPGFGVKVTFTVTVTAKTKGITSIGFVENFRYDHNGVETRLPDPVFNCAPLPIPPNGSCTASYIFDTGGIFQTDSVLINTILASVTLDDGSVHTDSSSASVTIGAPSSGCPAGWDITGFVTQGPEGATSHASGALTAGDPGYEALDIAAGMGDPIYSTVSGTVDIRQARELGVDERLGIIPDNCPGLGVVVYMHMSHISVADGDHVVAKQQIGRSGAYRSSDGSLAPHSHYQFNDNGDRSFPIQPPYIPTTVPRTCNGDCSSITTTAP